MSQEGASSSSDPPPPSPRITAQEPHPSAPSSQFASQLPSAVPSRTASPQVGAGSKQTEHHHHHYHKAPAPPSEPSSSSGPDLGSPAYPVPSNGEGEASASTSSPASASASAPASASRPKPSKKHSRKHSSKSKHALRHHVHPHAAAGSPLKSPFPLGGGVNADDPAVVPPGSEQRPLLSEADGDAEAAPAGAANGRSARPQIIQYGSVYYYPMDRQTPAEGEYESMGRRMMLLAVVGIVIVLGVLALGGVHKREPGRKHEEDWGWVWVGSVFAVGRRLY